MIFSLLFLADRFPLYRLIVIWSSTSGAEAVHVILDVVEAELADLDDGWFQ